MLWAQACSSDSQSAAERTNDKKIDAQSATISDDAKKVAKGVAKAVVDLASMGTTAFELSKIARQKATNPQVKQYARQTLDEHAQRQDELQKLAKQLGLALPATLSGDGKDRLDDLQKKTGTAFDIQYLKEMDTVNDKATDVADDLADDAPNDAVRTFAKKRLADDKKHRDQAKQLANMLS